MAKYMVRGRKPPSQGWQVFLANHAREIAAIDFFTVPTVNFRILICFRVQGRIVAEPQVGGLHHRDRRAA